MAEPGGAGNLLVIIASVIGVGVVAQVLADRFRVPSVVFLIAAGIAMGPEVTGVLNPEEFLGPLSAIVGLSVGIIVFEGAFHIRVDQLREAPSETFRLVTLGAVISLLGTAVTVHFLLGATWGIAFLIGALLVATGPTVITPILQVVPVRDRVATALETEGIVNDVTAAILAVVIFEAITAEVADPAAFATLFATKLGVGVLVGLIVAGLLWYAIEYVDLSPDNAPRNARLLVLAGALVAFAAANELTSEAGVAATATAGVVLGNADIPYEEEITDFKGDITLLVLSFVFIALAALLDPAALREVGLPGLGVVVAVSLVIRPLLVFVSTVGGRFTNAERVFISFVGPRGIIPASVATLFAVELSNAGLDRQANVLLGTVFLTILATAVVQGGLARHVAQYLDVIPMRVIIVGGGKVGRSLAERLEERGENIVVIEEDEQILETVRNAGFTAVHGDGTDTEDLREAGAENAKTVVAATGDDDANLLVSQLASSKFDVEHVIARANNPNNVEAFEDLGVRTISSAMATAWAIDNQIERPAIAHWMTDIGRSGDVQEVEVKNPDLIGKPISEVGPMLPEACLVALVSGEGHENAEVPTADYVLAAGDMVTLLGRRESVRDGMKMVSGD